VTERIPPHDIEAETYVIGGVLLDDSMFPELYAYLPEEAFYKAAHREIWRVMGLMLLDGKNIEVFSVHRALQKEGIDDIHALTAMQSAVPSTAMLMEYAESVRNRSAGRNLLEVCMKVENRVYGHEDPAIARAMLEDLLREQETASSGWVHMRDLPPRNGKRGFDVGIPALQSATGGLYTGLNILAGLPGAGKTTLFAQLANRIMAAGHQVSFVSMDQDVNSFDEVLRQSWAGIEEDDVKKHDYSGMPMLGAYYSGPTRLNDILAHLRVNASAGYKFALVDYLQIIDVPGNDADWQKSGLAAKALKRLALELGLTILLVVSFTKPKEGKRPSMDQIRGSLEICHAAEQIWILDQDADSGGRKVTLYLDKTRHKARSFIELDFRGDIRRFYDPEEAPVVDSNAIASAMTPGMAEIERKRRSASETATEGYPGVVPGPQIGKTPPEGELF
jgi:replicative DNA helicase